MFTDSPTASKYLSYFLLCELLASSKEKVLYFL